MSTLEARIAEVIAGHWSASTHTDREPFVDKCDGCGAVVRTWGESHGTWRDSPLASHQAAMLAPVITSSNAKAWHEGFNDGKRQDAEGEDGPRFTNPYRSNDE